MFNLFLKTGVRKRLFIIGWLMTIIIATPPILLFSNNKLMAMFIGVIWSFPILGTFYLLSKKYITQPIETLAIELEEIGKGDLKRKVDISIKAFGREIHDEFHTLNQSVNNMQKELTSIVKLIEKMSETSHQLISVTMPLFFNLSMITEEIDGVKLPDNIGDEARNEVNKVMDAVKTAIKDMENVGKKAEDLLSLSDELKQAAGMFKV